MNFIKKIILGIIASAVSVFLTTWFLPDYLVVASVGEGGIANLLIAFALAGFIFGILNSILRPILKILSFPFIMITGGLFIFIINAMIVFLTEYIFVALPSLQVSFDVQGEPLWYLVVAIILGLINFLAHWLIDIK